MRKLLLTLTAGIITLGAASTAASAAWIVRPARVVYTAPVYAAPVYAAPVYAAPVYVPPVYQPVVYTPPVYTPPVYETTYVPVVQQHVVWEHWHHWHDWAEHHAYW